MGAKQTDEFYSLMNVTNGNILSACLNGVSWGLKHKLKETGEVHTRQRNWKLSQFRTDSVEMLDHFINSEAINGKWSMGVHEIWVKEEDLDLLYGHLAMAVLRHFCGYAKQKALFGAFLFNQDPKLFIELDFTNNEREIMTIMKEQALGKKFLDFLEAFGVLSFSKGGHKYVNGKWTVVEADRCFFSTAELDLVKRKRKDITTTFEYKEETE